MLKFLLILSLCFSAFTQGGQHQQRWHEVDGDPSVWGVWDVQTPNNMILDLKSGKISLVLCSAIGGSFSAGSVIFSDGTTLTEDTGFTYNAATDSLFIPSGGDYHVGTVGLSDGPVGSSGSSLIGISTINGSTPNLQMFVDGTQSSQVYSGGVISENAALNGTIDITALTGYIKREADNEAMNMGSFQIAETTGIALSSGTNFVCVDYNDGTPVFSMVTYPIPNFTTIFAIGIAYKDVNNHVHVTQGLSNYLGLPYKVNSRFNEHEGTVRTSGLITNTRVYSYSFRCFSWRCLEWID